MIDDRSPRSDRFWGLSLQQQNDRGEIYRATVIWDGQVKVVD